MGSMMLWKTVVTLNGQPLGCVNIQRGIFQGDSLSPLLFVMCLFPLSLVLRDLNKGFKVDDIVISHLLYLDDLKLYFKSEADMSTLVNTVRIFSEDIRMNFGFDKCAILVINRGRATESEDIVLPGGTIEALPLSSSYKYLGVLEASDFQHKEMKSKIITTYKQRLRAILQSRLNGHNQIMAINGFAIPVVRYTAGIIHWTTNDCLDLDRLTRKQLTLYKALHPRADVDRLYVPRKVGGRGLLSVSNVVQVEMSALATYVGGHEDLIMTKVKQYLFMEQGKCTTKTVVMNEHIAQWHAKALHGQWPRLLIERSTQSQSCAWLRKAHLDPVTEAFIVAAQDQALCTNWLRHNIWGSLPSDHCRRCGQFAESVEHIVAGCPVMAQTVYLDRHNAVASAIHWSLCGSCGFLRCDSWWQHHPESVLENERYKLLYDFNIFTDHLIQARRPDLVYVNKLTRKTYLIDIACVMDHNVLAKEKEKVDKYLSLMIELQSLWNTTVEVVPIIFGALGSLSDNIFTNLSLLQVTDINAYQLQKTVLLRTATILRRHLALPSSS